MKVVLVTGGAGEIGSAICRQFAENGYDVIATYNSNPAKAEKLLAELNELDQVVKLEAPRVGPRVERNIRQRVEEEKDPAKDRNFFIPA